MKNIGRLLMFISIIIGVLIDCNVFKESIEIPIIVSGITFLLGIYILMLCENRYQIITYIITLPCSFRNFNSPLKPNFLAFFCVFITY
jgi:hypothetical protein